MKNWNLTLFFCLFYFFGFAQISLFDSVTVNWEQINNPSVGIFNDYYKHGGKLLGRGLEVDPWGVSEAFLFKSDDSGANWNYLAGGVGRGFCANQKFSFSISSEGVHRTDLDGNSELIYERRKETALTPLPLDHSLTAKEDIFNFNVINDSIIHFDIKQYTWRCGNGGCGYQYIQLEKNKYSTDYGETWEYIYPYHSKLYYLKDTVVTIENNNLVFHYNGNKTQLPSPVSGDLIYKFYYFEEYLNIIYVSDGKLKKARKKSNEQAWQFLESNVLDAYPAIIRISEDQLFISTKNGLYREKAKGTFEFEEIYTNGTINTSNNNFRVYGNEIYANTHTGALIHSSDLGENWTVKNWGLGSERITTMLENDGQLISFNELDKWYTWEEAEHDWRPGKFSLPEATDFVKFGDTIIVVSPNSISRSLDLGKTWETKEQGIFKKVFFENDVLFAVGLGPRYSSYRSIDKGETWKEIDFEFNQIEVSGDTIIVVSEGNLFRSTDMGQTWVDLFPKDLEITLISKVNNIWVAVSSDGAVFQSIDSGNSWCQKSLPFDILHKVHITDSLLFAEATVAGERNDFVSKDLGQNWFIFNFPYSPGRSILALSNNHYYHNWSDELHRTNWNELLIKIPDNSKNIGQLTGKLFYDVNNNCLFDSTDLAIKNKSLEFNPGPFYIASGETGNYEILLLADNNIIELPEIKYHEVCPNLDTIFIQEDSIVIHNIGYQSIPGNPDLSVNFHNQNPARPGFDINFLVNVKNVGTEKISNLVLNFSFPLGIFSVLDVPQSASVVDGLVSVPLTDFELYSERQFLFKLKLNASVPLGTEINLESYIVDSYGDKNLLDNIENKLLTVQDSYDPNDKQLLSGNELIAGDHEFEYLIRFQNTGTDTAFTVEVRDTLNGKLNPSSLKLIQTSHPFDFKIEDNRVLIWTFKNILLADSTTNEPESHGFIHFKIDTKFPLMPDEKINNKAAIYFDFNDPVITNSAQACGVRNYIFTYLDAELCSRERYSIANGSLYPERDTLVRDTFSYMLYDSVIVHDLKVFPSIYEKDTTLVIGSKFWFYGGSVDSSWQDRILNIRLGENEFGCDSIVYYNISIVEYSRVIDSTQIELCEGDSFNNLPLSQDTIFRDTFNLAIGFDSIKITNISVLQDSDYYIYESICFGDTLRFRDLNLTNPGDYLFIETAQNGCDSNLILNLTIESVFDTTIFHDIPMGSMFNDIRITNDTTIIQNLLSKNGCDSTVTNHIFVETSSAVNSLEKELSVKILPNPSHGNFHIEIVLPNPTELEIRLTDIHGRFIKNVLEKTTPIGGMFQLKNDLSSLPSGIYFIHFRTRNGGFLKKKIMKN